MMHIWCSQTFAAILFLSTEYRVWCINLGQLLDTYPATLSLLLNRTRGGNNMEKLIGQHKGKEITYHLPSWGNHCQLLPIKTDLDSEKQSPKD